MMLQFIHQMMVMLLMPLDQLRKKLTNLRVLTDSHQVGALFHQ